MPTNTKKVNKKLYKDICNNKLINQSNFIKRKCRALRVEIKAIANDKVLKRKIVIGTVIFLLVNIIIILLVTKTSIVPKVAAYIGRKIYNSSKPEHKQIAEKVQIHLPVVVEFAERYSDYFKTANKVHEQASNIYKAVVDLVGADTDPNLKLPGTFEQYKDIPLEDLPEKKLDERQAISLVNALFFGLV